MLFINTSNQDSIRNNTYEKINTNNCYEIYMKAPKTSSINFRDLISEIQNGEIKIPQFQRDFVWKIVDTANLLDSIVKNYPIGTFILWRTKEKLNIIKNIGGLKLPESRKDEYVSYVLDGQQRITSIFAAYNGKTIKRNGKDEDFSKIFIDLDAKDEDTLVVIGKEKKEEKGLIKFSTLCNIGVLDAQKWDEKYHAKLNKYHNIIHRYELPTINLKDIPLEIAAEIFTTINKHGKQLTVFEIMVAITYEEGEFDLAEKWKEFTKELEPLEYDTINNMIVLQLISLILKKDCKKRTILSLNKNEIIEKWEKIIESIKATIDYFRSHYRIVVSELLPYESLIVPFAYFMYKNEKQPNADQNKYLDDFFWRTSLAERYSSAVESKLAADVKRIEDILKNKQPDYDWTVNLGVDHIIQNGEFRIGSSYTKAILCIYAYQQPESFESGDIVNISNSALKKSNSKNYHHFFPKSFLDKKNVRKRKINSVLNITIVDDYLNKRQIGSERPSIYMKRFKENNLSLAETMKTHLIQDIESFGIWNDDYDLFLKKRAEELNKEMEKRIIERPVTNSTKTIDTFTKITEYDKIEQDYLSKKNIKELWEKIKNTILTRYPNVQFYMTGVYGGFKIEINGKFILLCIIEGLKNKIKLTYNIKITDDVLQASELLEDISKVGKHGEGEIRQYLTSSEDIDIMMKYLYKVVRYKTN